MKKDPTPFSSYTTYGITIATDYPFVTNLVASESPFDLTFKCIQSPLFNISWEDHPIIYTSPYRTETGKAIAYLYKLDDCYIW